MSLYLIVDDTVRVSDEIAGLTGVSSFGRLLYRRRTLVQHLEDAAADAGLPPPVVLSTRGAAAELEHRLAHEDWEASFLVIPTNIVAMAPRAELVTLLRQLRYVAQNIQLPVSRGADWSGLLRLDTALARRYLRLVAEGAGAADFVARHGADIAAIDNAIQFTDLRDQAQFLIFLTSNFDVRHFNAIVNENFTIVKRSTDVAKLRREFNYYGLLPPEVQMFFVQPFDFQQKPDHASYRMERLFLPDMAIQWVHGAIRPDEFQRFLDRVFHFVAVRPRRPVDRATALGEMDRLYWEKVAERIDKLKQLPEYARLGPLIDQAVGGIDALLERYRQLYFAARDRFPCDHLAIGHGDLCFSNVLYSKSTQLLRFIDPRGADHADELYTDPYYDIAKLSHSVQGAYDFINSGRFNIDFGTGLDMTLVTDEGDRTWARTQFRQMLERHGYDAALVRLCEASLFISMLPLHIDVPRKVLAFVLNAAAILDELSTG
ncbi:capsular biosynthesis protein [Paracidovorax citrulli]